AAQPWASAGRPTRCARGVDLPARPDHDRERGDRAHRGGDRTRVLRRRRDGGPEMAARTCAQGHRDRPRRGRGHDRPPRRRRVRPEPRRGGVDHPQPRLVRGRAHDGASDPRRRGSHRRRAETQVRLNGDLEVLQKIVDGALASLEASRQRIDDLNVYPVPDGDTGTNLTMTVRAVAEAVEHTSAASRQSLARDVARGALMGARGNSGVIFSQIVRGAADVLGETAAPRIDSTSAALALRGASDAAYRAVRRPVEGTMLSVIRELAEEAEARALEGSPLGDLLVELVRGVAATVSGEPLPQPPAHVEHLSFDAVHQELSPYRYCTVFLVEGRDLDRDALETKLEPLGDSLLVVGDPSALKVHVHTDDPGAALSLGTAAGTIDRIEIANMHEQTQQREERLLAAVPDLPVEAAATGVVAVVAGDGNRRLFETLARGMGPIAIVEGGQTMNPSTADLLAAVESLASDEAILLPNNSNIVLAAEHAAAHA